MKITKSKRTAVVARNERGDWTVKIDRFAAVLPATGPEVDAWVDAGKPGEVTTAPERITKLVGKLLSREKHKPTEPKRYDYKNGSGEWRHRFVPLDGEESVTMRPVAMRHTYSSPDNYPTLWAVFCDSHRCRGTELRVPGATSGHSTGYNEDQPCVALVDRNDYLDAGMVSRQITEAAEQAAYDARNAHIEWHRSTFGISGRVQLDRWLIENAMVAIPEPDRAEFERNLAIAKAERKARK